MMRQHIYTQNLFMCILYAIINLLYCSIMIRITDACLVYCLAKPIIKALAVDNALFSFHMQEK